MVRPAVLFTAPHDFLPPLSPFDQLFDFEFLEVWQPTALPRGRKYAHWVPNPGQHFVINGEVLARFPSLRTIATPSTGTDHIDLSACTAAGVDVFCLLDDRPALERISASAEFTFLHVLNALRRIDIGIEAVSAGQWRDSEERFRGHELAGQRIGLVGYGRIGRRLARYFGAFDAEVQVFDPYVSPDGEVTKLSSLRELFAKNDIIVICCLLTDETRGMIGGDLIELLAPGAIVVNTSRGEVLREDEVVEVLSRRPDLRLMADVVIGEVAGTHLQSPLVRAHGSGQVLITPHIAGATVESQHKAALSACAFIARRAGLLSSAGAVQQKGG